MRYSILFLIVLLGCERKVGYRGHPDYSLCSSETTEVVIEYKKIPYNVKIYYTCHCKKFHWNQKYTNVLIAYRLNLPDGYYMEYPGCNQVTEQEGAHTVYHDRKVIPESMPIEFQYVNAKIKRISDGKEWSFKLPHRGTITKGD